MQLWNDYEGRTVAEKYPLNKLIRPEGRSAFFSTTNGTGTPSIIRLIEAHFDEPEILNRWKTVAEMAQPNLLAMRNYGQTVLDGTPLVYAVMEPAEISLSDVLKQGTLTVDEVRQLATSLIGALDALHSHNLVHEHIQPEYIHAVGETVKLRSDCIRDATSGLEEDSPEIEARKARDVHDLVLVLLQALTGHSELRGSATLLPPPLDAIIRNGLSGTWGLTQMAAALTPPRPLPTPASTPAALQPEKTPEQLPLSMGTPPVSIPASHAAPQTPSPQSNVPAPPFPQAVPATPPRPVATLPPDVRHRIARPVGPEQINPRRTRMWIAIAVGVLLLLLLLWYLRSKPGTDQRPITTLAPAVQEKPAPARPPKPSAIPASGRPMPASVSPEAAATPSAAAPEPEPRAAGRNQWRVIAYTYNREDQAKQKAASVARRTHGLDPEVFSPSGRAPYLVSLGGAMSRDEAAALRRKAIAEGLPHDTYIQNYSR